MAFYGIISLELTVLAVVAGLRIYYRNKRLRRHLSGKVIFSKD